MKMQKYVRYFAKAKPFTHDLFSVQLESFCLVKREKKGHPLEMKVDFIHKNEKKPLEVRLKYPYGASTYLVDDLHNQYMATDLENINENAKEFPKSLKIRYSIYFPKLVKEARTFSAFLPYSFRSPPFNEKRKWSERKVVIKVVELL